MNIEIVGGLLMTIEKIKEDVKNTLSDFRYQHSLRVAEEAKKLATCYGYNEETAYVAGLIHDIAKDFTEEENWQMIKQYQLNPSLMDEEFKRVAHAEIGAKVAKERYQVSDEICEAVCYHTIGHIPMTILDKIVFVADKIGRECDTPSLKQIKKVAYENLDSAIFLIFKRQEQKLMKIGKKMHPDSIQLMNWLDQNLMK